MCRITDMKDGIAWNVSTFRREVIACVAIFSVKSFEILMFVSEIPFCSTSISTASP